MPHAFVLLVSLLAFAGAAHAQARGAVYHDRNANGRRDAGEPGIAGAAVSNQREVVATGADGTYTLNDAGTGVVFVSVPNGYAAVGPFWRQVQGTASTADFPMRRAVTPRNFTFIHASDTHIAPASVPRTERLRALVDSLRPDFVIITGDLVRDALRVSEAEATGYYDLFNTHIAKFPRPVWTVPGNHEIFGIERDKSGVQASHPLYGRAMYHKYRGPDYYSFNAGGIHFVGINTIDVDDTRYYGHVDSVQLAWLERDLALVPVTMPVVTFNHIPFVTAVDALNGYDDASPAPSTITVAGKTAYRHVVSNAREVFARIKGHPYPLALQGHMHVSEITRYDGIPTRFHTSAATVADTPCPGLT
ncbi:MAG: metallophosphoesterase, partial [Cytophagaceae bacterium]|nr:metallophosphoesterase [Gemmatimonadaceae bacterium]